MVVLLVEDEPDILATLSDLLGWGLRRVAIVGVPDGAEAARLLAERAFDLVLSDYRLPGMDGLAVLGAARALQPDVPLVMLTAYPDLGVAVRAVNEARVDRFLQKPIDPDELLAIVGSLLDGRAAELGRQAAFARAAAIVRERLMDP